MEENIIYLQNNALLGQVIASIESIKLRWSSVFRLQLELRDSQVQAYH